MIPLGAMIAIHIPAVQTAILQKVTGALSRNYDGRVNVGRMYFHPLQSLVLRDVGVFEASGDTLIWLDKVALNLNEGVTLGGETLEINRLTLENGVMHVRQIDTTQTNLSYFISCLGKPEEEEQEESSFSLPFTHYRLDRLLLNNLCFSYEDEFTQDFPGYCIDSLTLRADDLNYGTERQASLSVKSLHARETTTGAMLDFSCGYAFLSDSLARIDRLRLSDGLSEINLNGLYAMYDSPEAFNNVEDSVSLRLSLSPSTIDLRSLHPFVGESAGMTLRAMIEADISGSISNINVNRIRLSSESGLTDLKLKGYIRGLTDIDNSSLNLHLYDSYTDVKDLGRMLSGTLTGFDRSSLSSLPQNERLLTDATLSGSLRHFIAKADITTVRLGQLHAEAEGGYDGNATTIDGNITGQHLDLGSIIAQSPLGILDFDAALHFAAAGTNAAMAIDPLRITRLDYNNHTYGDIELTASTPDMSSFTITMDCGDPLLDLTFNGLIHLDAKGGNRYIADLDIHNLDLSRAGLDSRSESSIQANLDANILQQGSHITGELQLAGITGIVGNLHYYMGGLDATAQMEGEDWILDVLSDAGDIHYRGTDNFKAILRDIQEIAGKRLPYLVPLVHDYANDPDDVDYTWHLDATVGKPQPILDYLNTGIIVASGSRISAFQHQCDSLHLKMDVPFAGAGSLYVKDMKASLAAYDGPMRLAVGASLIQAGDMRFDNDLLNLVVADNRADLDISFDNGDEGQNAHLITHASALRPIDEGLSLAAAIDSSIIGVGNGIDWIIEPARLSYSDRILDIHGLKISNGGQYLSASGAISPSVEDTVRVNMNRFDIGIFNGLVPLPFPVEGTISGKGTGSALLSDARGINLDMTGYDLMLDHTAFGQLDVDGNWNPALGRFDFKVENLKDGRYPLLLDGFYRMADSYIDLNVSLDSLSTPFINNLVPSLAVDMGVGSLSGDIAVRGPFDNLSIQSQGVRFNMFEATFAYTKVPYIFDGPFEVRTDGVYFPSVDIYDHEGHTGKMLGKVLFNGFEDLYIDLTFLMDNMFALNTTAEDNSVFYGHAHANANIHAIGPLSKLYVDVQLSSRQDSNLHVAIGGTSEVNNSILTYVAPEEPTVEDDPYSAYLKRREKARAESNSQLDVRVRAHATPDIEIILDINPAYGDMLRAFGNGDVDIRTGVTPFDIKGNYEIDRGSYKFALMGVTSKDFILNSGSTITFNGDVMNSDLNLDAIYRTKASINTLIADSTSTARRTVDCGIGIGGKLSNPQLTFSIDIPDLDPTTAGRVASVLNTEEKRLKQVLALLISGSFVPDEQSGIVNNTTILYSNLSEIMANQVNTIFRQLDIPLDLGFNYQPGSDGMDMFDVAISTQLFNNRVTINGNIGNQRYLSSSTSEIVGNVDIDLKMTPNGNLRLNIFSHAADRFSNYLDQTQRNGIGVVYQQEFDSFREFLRNLFSRRKTTAPDAEPAPGSGGASTETTYNIRLDD